MNQEERMAWLASLKVGDKVVWVQPHRIRGVYTILRETPKCWVISKDGWLVNKATGVTRNVLSGIAMQPYRRGTTERQMAAQAREETRLAERATLLSRIQNLPNSKLRQIVKEYAS